MKEKITAVSHAQLQKAALHDWRFKIILLYRTRGRGEPPQFILCLKHAVLAPPS